MDARVGEQPARLDDSPPPSQPLPIGQRHSRRFTRPLQPAVNGRCLADRGRTFVCATGGRYDEFVTWQPMSLAIETERLTLRLRDERDAAWHRELIAERGEDMPTLEEATTRLARFRDLTTEIGIGALAIYRPAEGDVIG